MRTPKQPKVVFDNVVVSQQHKLVWKCDVHDVPVMVSNGMNPRDFQPASLEITETVTDGFVVLKIMIRGMKLKPNGQPGSVPVYATYLRPKLTEGQSWANCPKWAVDATADLRDRRMP